MLIWYAPLLVRQFVAETKGFEPSRPFRAYSLSRGAPSTTRPRLRRRVYKRKRRIYKVFSKVFQISSGLKKWLKIPIK